MEALHNWGLALQEQADQVGTGKESKLTASAEGEARFESREELLKDACDKYQRAHELRPGNFRVLYNWGVALSDLARMQTSDTEVERLQSSASERYKNAAMAADSAAATADNPSVASSVYSQALNNRGLAFQNVASKRRSNPSEAQSQLSLASSCFRDAIRPNPTFHRAVYNLGTALHSWADLGGDDARVLRSASAACVALASALCPSVDVYRRSLALVQRHLPPSAEDGEPVLFSVWMLKEPAQPLDRAFRHLWRECCAQVRCEEVRVIRPAGSDESIPMNELSSVEPVADSSLPCACGIWLSRGSYDSLFLCAKDSVAMDAFANIAHVSKAVHSLGLSSSLHSLISSEMARAPSAELSNSSGALFFPLSFLPCFLSLRSGGESTCVPLASAWREG